MAILHNKKILYDYSRCLYGSEVALFEMVICKNKMPLTDILQDNEHLIHGLTSICDLNSNIQQLILKSFFFLVF